MMKSHLKIAAQIDRLLAQQKAIERKRSIVLRGIVVQMRRHDITIEELGKLLEKGGRKRVARQKVPTRNDSANKRKAVADKYKDDAGNKWSGRGRAPLWLVAAEKAGITRESLLV